LNGQKPLSPGDQTRATLIKASQLGSRVWRMNVGLAWVGEVIEKSDKIIVLSNPRPFKAGVEGMSDCGGFTPVTVTADMVGKTLPVYTAMENKSGTGRLSTEQRSFLEMVHRNGGLAGVVRSLEDVETILAGKAGPPYR